MTKVIQFLKHCKKKPAVCTGYLQMVFFTTIIKKFKRRILGKNCVISDNMVSTLQLLVNYLKLQI